MPAARTPENAARRFIQGLIAATSCVTAQRLTARTTYFTPGENHSIQFPDPPVSLRSPTGGPRGLLLDITHVFSISESQGETPRAPLWRVATRMYQYRLLDQRERELLVYHWQPGSRFLGPDHPHVHVSAAISVGLSAVAVETVDLHGRHLATGIVSLAAFVRMLIEEFGVAPQRSDWRDTLARAAAEFHDDSSD